MTTVIADADGNKVGHVIYDPFGEIVESTLAITPTDRFFTGQRWDGTIGLYDYEYLRYLSQILRPTIRPVHSTRQPGDGGNESHRLEQVRVRSQQPSNFAEIAVNYTDSTGHFIDTLWDAWDLAND
ncbi:MAG: hypothetical protein GY832_26510, partial [Chloroflexi bacterium]|nr:hypothetical protein [Chloroflexota bacterium]